MYPHQNRQGAQSGFGGGGPGFGGGGPGFGGGGPPRHGIPGQSSRRGGGGSQSNTSRSTCTPPGQPHYTGVRAVRSAARIESIICGCRDPNSHGDAFTFDCEEWANDTNGTLMSWTTGMNRILDIYGRTSMTRQEAIAKYGDVMRPDDAANLIEQEKDADENVGKGVGLETNPYTTWHNADGHRRPHLTEEGLRTVLQRPSQSGNTSQQSGSHGQNLGCPAPGQGQSYRSRR